jgi:hypothetical protein
LFKSIFQIPIFVLMYILIVYNLSFQNPTYGFFMVILLVVVIIIISDAISFLIAFWINKKIIHRWGYLLSPTQHKERLRGSVKYVFYILLRALAFVFALVWLLSAVLFKYFSGWSFLIAWIVISLVCKALSTFITDYGIFRI